MPDPKIELYLLGTPELRLNGRRLDFDTRKALALLAYLVVTERTHSRDILAALLWGELDQTNARASLRRTLSTLNKGLQGMGLAIERESIGPNPEATLWADVTEFSHNLQSVKAALAKDGRFETTAATGLEKLVTLWRGEFMQGFSLRDSPEFEEWQSQIAENLQRDYAWTLEKLAGWYASNTNFDQAQDYARRWLALDSLNEEAHRRLMQFYAWNGQTSLALKQYQECVQVLERELGVPPLEATTTLYEAIKERRLQAPTLSEPTPLENPSAIKPGLEAPAAGSLPLLGRDEQWQELERAWQSVLQTGRGRLVVVEGEAGIGKTRLVEEFVGQKQAGGVKVTRVSCYEGETEMAFVPVSTLLQKAFGTQSEQGQLEAIEEEWRSEAARLVPRLGSGLPPAPTLDNPGAQGHFYEGLRQMLVNLCGSPGVLFFDDVQWIDGASLDFLTYFARRLPQQSLCLILAWRSGTLATQPKLAQLLVTSKRQDYASLINLARLNRLETEVLIKAGLPDTSPELTQILFAETEGLPFFILEYLDAYRRGLFQLNTFEKPGNSIVPGGVRDLLESRVKSLSEMAQQLLQSAAVIGQGFDFDTLYEVSGRSETETITGLEELVAASVLIVPEQNGADLRYDFSHEKLRKFIYENISPGRVRLLHRRVAETLANRKADISQLYGQIGYHYRQAGHEVLAAVYYKRAGDYARALFANREALNHYQTALALGYSEIGPLHEALADIYTLLGEYNAALHQYQLAAQQPPDSAGLEYKAGKIYLWRGDWELAISQFETALKLAGDNQGLAAQISTDWSLALHHLNQDQAARLLAEQALEQAVKAADKRAQAQAHNVLGLLAGNRGDTSTAMPHLKESLALSEAINEPTLQAAALNNLARVYWTGGDLEQALTLTKAALEIVFHQGDRHRQAALLSNLGDLYQASGQSEKARASVKESVSIYTEIGLEAGTYQPGVWMLTDW